MKLKRLSFAVLLAGLVTAAAPVLAQELENQPVPVRSYSVTAPDPALQIRDLVRLLRSNDVAGLLQAAVPPSNYSLLRDAYERQRSEPVSDTERAEFAEGLDKLIAPDAVDRMMAEIEPKLAKARPQASGAIMMGMGALQVALASEDSKLTTAQRESLQAAMPGLQRWVSSTDFLSALSMRDALTLVSDAARRTGVRSIDDLRALSFEQLLAKSGTMFGAGKDALRIYGLDFDAIANSLQVQTLSIEGDTARVRTTVTVFDAPVSSEHELVLVEGRWYGKHAADAWKFHHKAKLIDG
jgi:hypothetical protein